MLCLAIQLALAGFSGNQVQAATLRLTLDGQAGDFTTQGGDFDLMYDSAAGSTINVTEQLLIGGTPSAIVLSFDNAVGESILSNGNFTLRTTETGVPLSIGTFDGVPQAVVAGEPRFQLGFQHRGTTNAVSDIEITDLAFTNSSTGVELERLAFTFDVVDAGPNDSYSGTASFNATAVPEPGVFCVCVALSAAGVWRKRRR